MTFGCGPRHSPSFSEAQLPVVLSRSSRAIMVNSIILNTAQEPSMTKLWDAQICHFSSVQNANSGVLAHPKVHQTCLTVN